MEYINSEILHRPLPLQDTSRTLILAQTKDLTNHSLVLIQETRKRFFRMYENLQTRPPRENVLVFLVAVLALTQLRLTNFEMIHGARITRPV